MASPEKPRLLTGDRPTGPLHLGHLVGSLQTRVALQDSHECFIIVADLHTLTTRPNKPQIGELRTNVREVVLDLLGCGIDPAKATIYLQSGVPAVYDLAILLQMLIPFSRLQAIPSIRSMATAAGLEESAITMGLLGYPVLQAADILMARAEVVPVGQDNVEHVDIARELASVFNDMYGTVFPVPEARISRFPALPGVDTGLGGSGNKMSKSLGNAIFLRDDPSEVARKIGTLEADADRPSADQAIFDFVDAFLSDDDAARVRAEFESGKLSADAVRDRVVRAIESVLEPMRARRAEVAAETGRVEEIVVDGTIRAREVAYQTLQDVRTAMGLEDVWADLVSATEARAQARKKPY